MKNSGVVDPVVNMVFERFSASESSRSSREDKWNKAYQYYRGINDNTDNEYFINETFTVIETILPRLTGDFLNVSKPIISVQGRNREDHNRANSVEALLGYSFIKDKLPLKYVDFCRQALVYGTAIGKTYWNLKKRIKKSLKNYNDGITSYPYIDQEEVNEFDDPSFEVIPIYDFFVDPAATSIEDARYCIQRKLLTREEIESLAALDVYKPDVVKDLPAEGAGYEDSAKKQDRSISNYTTDDSVSGIPRKFEILEYWEDDRVVVLCDRLYILRDDENPFWHGRKPFIMARFTPLPFEFYGLGIPELIEPLQKILNDISNLRLKNVKLAVNRMFMRMSGQVDDRQLRSRPGGIIDINNPDFDKVLRVVEWPDVTASSYTEVQNIQQAIQNSTGASDYIRGISSDVMPKQTATEVNQKTQQAATRFIFTYKLMVEQSLMEIARHFLYLLQQYMTEEKSVKILGQNAVEFKNITPVDIQGEYDFILAVDPTHVDEQNRRMNILQFYQITASNPIITNPQMPMVNLKSVIEEVAESLELDVNKLIPNPGEEMPMPGMMPGMEVMNGPVPPGAISNGGAGGSSSVERIAGTVPPAAAAGGMEMPLNMFS